MDRRGAVLREAAAGLLLFGSLIGRTDLHSAGGAALDELQARRYATIDATSPVRVYPIEPGAGGEANEAADWSPGVVSLRPEPVGGTPASTYLRHELMHEANFRTCGGRLPLWADEAAAIAFSGESIAEGEVDPRALDRLRDAVRTDRRLAPGEYRALARLVAQRGWPREPCAISNEIAAIVVTQPVAPLSWIVASAVSGRVLEAGGDPDTRWPPGSLLKIPFAAALDGGDSRSVGVALARSDATALLALRGSLDRQRYELAVRPLGEVGLPPLDDERAWHALLGERRADGTFIFEVSLEQLAQAMRVSLLLRPETFAALGRSGGASGSTLERADDRARRALRRLGGLAKTGTVSNARGAPIIGSLFVAWPADRPEYVAVLRQGGQRGASLLSSARDLLDRWATSYPAKSGEVRVRLFSLLEQPRQGPAPAVALQVELLEPCAGANVARDGVEYRMTSCGELRFRTGAPGARPERIVRGIVSRTAQGWILITDPESYADAVVDAEAGDLRGEAREALRAVVVWNGLHGRIRHPEQDALCDTSHCMTFLGLPPGGPAVASRARVQPELLALLDRIARQDGLGWFPFSKGGSASWSRSFADGELARAFREPVVLDIARERRRTGAVVFHLTYASAAETVPCDAVQRALALPSCPSAVGHDGAAWRFTGVGEGHGLGLDIERARVLSSEGRGAAAILRDGYGRKE
jgi:hypothetical protein